MKGVIGILRFKTQTLISHMKTSICLHSKGLIGLALLTAALPAWGQATKFDVKADVGGNITQDTNLREFFGPVAPGTKVKFDPGFRAGLGGGYNVTDWFAGE